ncbi:MAG: hypothetical protein ACI8RZ_001110 [Myxococcota bacterium]|jgi:hypothetical protein
MNEPAILAELRVKPSMSGLTATIHGTPRSMRGVATGLMVLGGLTLAAFAITAGGWIHITAVTSDLLLAALVPLMAVLIGLNQRHGSQVLSRIHRFLRGYLLPTQKSVAVVELTPKQLLINGTAQLPVVVPTADIIAIRRQPGVLILDGPQPPIQLDVSLNSAAAVDWLEAELARIIAARGTHTSPPEALKRLLQQKGAQPEASRE